MMSGEEEVKVLEEEEGRYLLVRVVGSSSKRLARSLE